jgi:tRNA nucleotidyltransferase/poly(A) polymerase
MPDFIYLLENRLSADQRSALRHLREAAREAGMILFLTADAVRDLTSGHSVRELEVTVHGNALKLKKTIEKMGGVVWGEDELAHTLYLCFPGTVRVDVVSAHRVEYPKPGQAVVHTATIQEDLRRRDFTVNAMAISLNEGSFGLLMDPLNGAADIEARTLRLVSNYGFYDDPSLLIRATRFRARLGWELDHKTATRYANAKGEDVIQSLSAEARSRELEQIGHEDDGLKVLHALDEEGWLKILFPAWTPAKADEEKLKLLHEQAVELLLQGVHADMSAAQMQLLTAKLAPKDLAALKKLMLRPGFVEEWNSLDQMAAGFAKVLLAKENLTPSTSYKLFTSYDPEAVLWLGFTSHDKAVRERYNLFLKTWPEVRQRLPHALMQEMRITPELATYPEIVHNVFLEMIDGKLTTSEEIRAFLEPHSPPAPPPKETVKRTRAKRGEAKVKDRSYDDDDELDGDLDDDDDDLDDLGADDEEEIDLKIVLPVEDLGSGDDDLDDDDLDATGSDLDSLEAPPRGAGKSKAPKVNFSDLPVFGEEPEGDAPEPVPAKAGKAGKSTVKPAVAAKSLVAAKPATKPAAKPSAPTPAPVAEKPAKPAAAKAVNKPAAKEVAKAPAKPAAKLPAKGKAAPPAKAAAAVKPGKAAEKKPAPKPSKKH